MSARFFGSLRGAVLVVLCSLLAYDPNLDANGEEPKPKDFFKHNYAAAPGYEGVRQITEMLGSETRSTKSPAQGSQIEREQASSLPKLPIETKKPVVYVLVNSLDRTHFNRVIQETIRLHDSKRAIVVGVFHIGDYEAVTPAIGQEMSSREIKVYQISTVFRELFAESSPAWVVSTRQGRHVAEGILEITPFFDEWGEYDPKRVEEPEDKSTMEEF